VPTLPIEDVDEVHRRFMVYYQRSGLTYTELASRCGLRRHQVRDFARRSRINVTVVRAIVTRLPLGLAWQPCRVLPQ